MDEFELIRRYFARHTSDQSVVIGVGDDGAVTRLQAGCDLVTVIDTMVAGVHFPPMLEPADIGYRAVAVNLSDIAAMAATPKWMTLALTLHEAEPAWLEAFAEGLYCAADEHDVTLIGGDTTRGPETVVTIQIGGEVNAGAAISRSGAIAGDKICVTGTPGDAATGLAILQSGGRRNDDMDYLVQRFSRPRARIRMAQQLAPLMSAAIDLSDGLYTDLEKLLAASGARGTIEVSRIPLSAELRRVVAPDAALQSALAGGDDYELCFTTAASGKEIARRAAGFDTAITCIGVISEGAGLVCTRDGETTEFQHAGYRHFGG